MKNFKKRHIVPVLLIGLAAGNAFAAAKNGLPASSLFFSNDEMSRIVDLVDRQPPETPRISASDIYLGGVMYYGPGRWTLWLRGRRWTPHTDPADLQVTAVAPDVVHMIWNGHPGTEPHPIDLHPDQTYQTATGDIVEGVR